MEDFKKFYNQSKARSLMKNLFGDFDNRDKLLSKKHYFDKWRNKAEKMKERENSLKEAMNEINTRYHINSAKLVNSACLAKKLFKTIPKARALDFLRRLRNNANMKKKFDDISNSLQNANND